MPPSPPLGPAACWGPAQHVVRDGSCWDDMAAARVSSPSRSPPSARCASSPADSRCHPRISPRCPLPPTTFPAMPHAWDDDDDHPKRRSEDACALPRPSPNAIRHTEDLYRHLFARDGRRSPARSSSRRSPVRRSPASDRRGRSRSLLHPDDRRRRDHSLSPRRAG
ncbi:hypothetical protein ZWY2020_046531 [Hordeum vulgare]|nr:hypothetical protein ZWY2020_046531 [Hordeum vulgare]